MITIDLRSKACQAALAAKGLRVIGEQSGTLLVRRSLDSPQQDPSQLDVSHCLLENCCVLEGESDLQHLDLSANHLPLLSPLHTSSLTSITSIDLSRNHLSDIGGISFLMQLRKINLARNKLEHLEHLKACCQLHVLDIHHNQLTDLSALTGLHQLVVINAAANNIQQLTPLQALTRLTELNLRANKISNISTGNNMSSKSRTATAAADQQCLFPPSLRRLSLSCNHLSSVSSLLPLQLLPALEDLAVDSNPFAGDLLQQQTGATQRSSSSSGDVYRDVVLSCCPPSLLMLDMQLVSPSERLMILRTGVKSRTQQRSAPQTTQTQQQQQQPPGRLVAAALGQAVELQQKPRTILQTLPAAQPNCLQQQQQLLSRDGGVFKSVRLPVLSNDMLATAGSSSPEAASPEDSRDEPIPPHIGLTPPAAADGRLQLVAVPSYRPPLDTGAASVSSCSILPGTCNKLRPQTIPDISSSSCYESSSRYSSIGAHDIMGGLQGHGLRRSSGSSGSNKQGCWPAAAAAAAVSSRAWHRTSSAPAKKLSHHDALDEGSSTAIDNAALRAWSWSPRPMSDSSSSSTGNQINIGTDWQEEQQYQQQQTVNTRSRSPSSTSSGGAGTAAAAAQLLCSSILDNTADGVSAHETLLGNAATENNTSKNDDTAAAAAAAVEASIMGPLLPAADRNIATYSTPNSGHSQQQQQQQPLTYDGVLKLAAISCGVTVRDHDSIQQQTDTAQYDHDDHDDSDLADYDADDISESEVHHHLQANRMQLVQRRHRCVAAAAAPPPPSTSFLQGVALSGNNVILTGDVLHALRGEALAHVTGVTIQDLSYDKVVSGVPLLRGLRRLSSLSLVRISGLSLLPQLHPLLLLTRLKQLTVADCRLSGLTLLRHYVVFRFPHVTKFNGSPVTDHDVSVAAGLFNTLEATLEAALQQVPQQAALAASGVLRTANKKAATSGPAAAAAAVTTGAAANSSAREVSINPSRTLSPLEPWMTSTPEPMQQEKQLQQQQQQPDMLAAAVHHHQLHYSYQSCDHVSRRNDVVSDVFAAINNKPLLPAAHHIEQGRAFADQFIKEVAAVQQHLQHFHNNFWPDLVKKNITVGWTGNLPS